MSNFKGRINKIMKTIGAGLPFREGVGPGMNFSTFGFFKRGQARSDAPPGFRRAAILLGMCVAISYIQSSRTPPEKLLKARKALHLGDGPSDPVTILERCRTIARDAGFNVTEMAKLESVIGGMARKTNAWSNIVNPDTIT